MHLTCCVDKSNPKNIFQNLFFKQDVKVNSGVKLVRAARSSARMTIEVARIR